MTEKPKTVDESILPFKKGNEFYWPTDFKDSYYCLSRLPYAVDKKDIFPGGQFSGELSEKLELATKDWPFLIIIKSALYFHLEFLKQSRKETNEPSFLWVDWYDLIFIFLNENTSKKEVLEIFYFMYEAPEEETLLGVKRALAGLSISPLIPVSPESLNNLLIFLKIDIVSREFLVKKTFKNKNIKDLLDFLTF